MPRKNKKPDRGGTPQQKRADYYAIKCDELLISAVGYEHEGETAKAVAAWEEWTALRAQIRLDNPDVV